VLSGDVVKILERFAGETWSAATRGLAQPSNTGVMPTAALSRRVGQVVGYPPLVEMDDLQRREFHEALLEVESFEGLPGKWQAAILKAEQSRPKLRVITRD
jgi:hypothetical protein